MQISENALSALTACEYRGIGKAWVNKNLRGGESEAQIVAMVSEKDGTATVSDFERRRLKILSEI